MDVKQDQQPIVSDDEQELAETLENLPTPTTAPKPENPKKPGKKADKPQRTKADDTRAADVFGSAFQETMSQAGAVVGDTAEKAASGFTKECLHLCEDEITARYVRLGLTGFALAMVCAIPIARALGVAEKPKTITVEQVKE